MNLSSVWFFLGALELMLIWEWRKPFRTFPESKPRRFARYLGFIRNFGLSAPVRDKLCGTYCTAPHRIRVRKPWKSG